MLSTTYKSLREEGFDREEASEIMTEMQSSEDFEHGNYRFIADAVIDETMQEELASDAYILGCFNASFLAGILDMPVESVEAIQKAEQFEALGHIILANPAKIQELQEDYRDADGYGHHFAHYDGVGREVWAKDSLWHLFRTN